MNKIVWGFSCLMMLSIAVPVWGDESDDLRAKAKAVKQEADTLAKKGQKEEAEKHYRAAKELMQMAEERERNTRQRDSKSAKPDADEVGQLHRRLKELVAKEQSLAKSGKDSDDLAAVRKQRAAVERELIERQKAHDREEGEKPNAKPGAKRDGKHLPKEPEALQEMARRIKHIQVAIENLREAEMHDLAAELSERVEDMQRELHRARELHAKSEDGRHDKDDRENDDKERGSVQLLRDEVHRLRQELNELRQRFKKAEQDDD